MKVQKFVCKQCGHCCSDYGENKLLPIHKWEADKLNELAIKKQIPIDIRPINTFYDKKSNLYFCLAYGMYTQPCPFLENNKCSIYSHRPLVCKLFPVLRYFPVADNFNPYLNFFNYFGTCKHNDPKLFFKDYVDTKKIIYDKKDIYSKVKTIYGSLYIFSYYNEYIFSKLRSLFIQLEYQEIIDPQKIDEKDITNKKVYYLLDFIEKIGYKNKKEIKDIYYDYSKREISLKNI